MASATDHDKKQSRAASNSRLGKVDKWRRDDPTSIAERDLRREFLAALSCLVPNCVQEWKQAVSIPMKINWAKKWHLTLDGNPVDWILFAIPGPNGLLPEGCAFPSPATFQRDLAIRFTYDPLYTSRSLTKAYVMSKIEERLDAELDRIDTQAPGEVSPEWRELRRDVERFVRFQVLEERIPLLFTRDPDKDDQIEGVRKNLRRTADRLGITLRKGPAGRPRKNKSPTS